MQLMQLPAVTQAPSSLKDGVCTAEYEVEYVRNSEI